MPIRTEKLRRERLKEHGLVLNTRLFDTKVHCISSADAMPEDVCESVILKKEYLAAASGKVLHSETEFNPCVHYSFISVKSEDGNVHCTNCGYADNVTEFLEGCPYCGSYLNIDFEDKSLGAKNTASGKVKAKEKLLQKLPLFTIPPFLLGAFITFTGGRTHTAFDFFKGGFIALFFGFVAFLCFYLSTGNPNRAEEQQKLHRQQQELAALREAFRQGGMPLHLFYNELSAALERTLFSEDSTIVDIDTLDYNYYHVEGDVVSVTPSLRILRKAGRRITVEECGYRVTMRYRHSKETHGINLIRCPNCGASIDASTMKCSYCDTIQEYTPPFVLVSLEKCE